MTGWRQWQWPRKENMTSYLWTATCKALDLSYLFSSPRLTSSSPLLSSPLLSSPLLLTFSPSPLPPFPSLLTLLDFLNSLTLSLFLFRPFLDGFQTSEKILSGASATHTYCLLLMAICNLVRLSALNTFVLYTNYRQDECDHTNRCSDCR